MADVKGHCTWCPWHEHVWGSGDKAPRFLGLGTRWKWVVCFTPLSVAEPQRLSGPCENDKNYFQLQEIETRSLGLSVRSSYDDWAKTMNFKATNAGPRLSDDSRPRLYTAIDGPRDVRLSYGRWVQGEAPTRSLEETVAHTYSSLILFPL